MSEGNNAKNNKSSFVVLILVIAIIVGVIGFGVYQNMSNNQSSTPDQAVTSEEVTTVEPTTQIITTAVPTTEEPTTIKPTEPPTTKAPETEPPTENYSFKAYTDYLNVIQSSYTEAYYLIDIDKDGIIELIAESGNSNLTRQYTFYSYKISSGIICLGNISGSSKSLYTSYNGELKSFGAKQGSYSFYEYSIVNNEIIENLVDQGYTQGDYPNLDGDYLKSYSSYDTTALINAFN